MTNTNNEEKVKEFMLMLPSLPDEMLGSIEFYARKLCDDTRQELLSHLISKVEGEFKNSIQPNDSASVEDEAISYGYNKAIEEILALLREQ